MKATPSTKCPSTFLQYDINSGEITQEYDQHLGPVNTITFVDENRRFVTTSDDKTIRAWDFDVPVVIKYIAEPHMHSMPAVTLHPSSMSVLDNSLGSSNAMQGNTSLPSRWIIKSLFIVQTTSGKIAKSDSLATRLQVTPARWASPRMENG
jgi:WD40 repeat protein